MDASLRACIANIVGRVTGQGGNSAVYDHTQSKHIHVSGKVSSCSVQVYDHNRGAHITGVLPNLYDHSLGSHISLNMNGTQFSGYDYRTSRHYSGNINGNTVVIYDHESDQHHHYVV